MSELTNLKDYLIKNNIRTYLEFKKCDLFNYYENEYKRIRTFFHYGHNHKATIEYIKMNCDIKCKCGSGLNVFWKQNDSCYGDYCDKCKPTYKGNSTIVKQSRSREITCDVTILEKHRTIIEIDNLENINVYLGSGKQRTFIKDNRQLYFSILHWTKHLDDMDGINLRGRISALKNPNLVKCSCGDLVKLYDNVKLKFHPVCQKCEPKRDSINWFKLYHPDDWEKRFKEMIARKRKAAKGIHTIEWYINKYGKSEGKHRFDMHIEKMSSNQSHCTHSKISLNLFNNLVNEGFSEAEFGTHPKEKMFKLDEKYAKLLGQNRIFVDFVYKDKIIEFQGSYWHRNTSDKDNLRKQFLESLGYKVLFIYENEYKADQIRELKKCINFLNDIPVQNRYLISTESGYSHFMNISNNGEKNTLLITLENSDIEVSLKHKFFINKKEVFAKDLKIGDKIKTKNGNEKVLDIKKSKNTVYDVIDTKDHTYYGNGILNHNCEFLGSSHTLISAEKLKMMEPGEVQEIRDGKLKIYHYPEPKHQYIMTVDAAKDGTDNFAVQVVDITDFKFKQVAAAQLQIDYLLMPEFIAEWCEFYNNPYLIIENNEGAGQSIADQLRNDYEYENLHYDKDIGRNKKKKYPGFRTTTKTRKQILQTLKLFIENSNLEVNDASTISEFFQFILINNKYQADEGAHDDMIMSLALVFVPFCNAKNFEDMKLLVKQLYADHELQETEKVNFGDLLAIGEFQDYSDEEMHKPTETHFGGYMITEEFE